jgi:hypothetical protein
MIDIAIGCGALAVLLLADAAIEGLMRPKCKHEWKVLSTTYDEGAWDRGPNATVLLACDDCGKIEKRALPGKSR